VNINWRSRLATQLATLVGGCALVGWPLGHVGLAMALGLAVYLAFTLRHLLRLHAWLLSEAPGAPPEAGGLWGDVLDRLYRRQRHEQRQRDELIAVIGRAQASTEALRDAIILVDRHGNLEWWNRAAETLLGLRQPQDLGQPITNLVRHPRFADYFVSGDYGEPLELASPLNDDQYLHILVTRFGEGDRLLLVRDVTRIHQLEQMRKDFVANVSHELRTPLTVITGYLETLLDNADHATPRWRRALGQMQQQAGRMQHTIDDLLLLARLEATDYPADNRPVALAPLLGSILQDGRALSGAIGHRLSLDCAPDLALLGSETELRSCFSNLVFNAVKYSPTGGEVRIRAWQDAGGAHVAVQDTGPGIDARHLPRLTERFYRIDASRASSTGGTGLGLAIVKHVLIRHRGALDIHSVVGEGSCFTCHFQAEQIARPAAISA